MNCDFFANEPFQTSSNVFTIEVDESDAVGLVRLLRRLEVLQWKSQTMLHFSCDLCGIPLDDQRFVVQLEAYPAFDPDQLEASDLDADHLQQVAQELETTDSESQQHAEACETKKLRFDLCARCYHKFLRDPLGRETARRLSFSKN